MSEAEADHIHEVKEALSIKLKDLINHELRNEPPAVDEAVREQLGETFRFW